MIVVVSMTGFGRGQVKSETHTVTVEIKSVNHRYCEYYIRIPRQFVKLEEKIKKKLSSYINRGKVDVFVSISGDSLVHRTFQVDWRLAEDYYQLVQSIKEKFSLDSSITLQDFLQREDFITVDETDEENEGLSHVVLEAVERAAEQFDSMRKREGEQLYKDFLFHLKHFEKNVADLRVYAPKVTVQYREKLEKKMKDYLNEAIDEARILTEVALFAEKSDITEELTRLESHVKQFYHSVQSHEPLGRKLDFIIQEMNREVNTVGSKANDSTIAGLVVELKTTLEKVREQVQNVE